MREIRRTMRETMRNQVQPKETMRNQVQRKETMRKIEENHEKLRETKSNQKKPGKTRNLSFFRIWECMRIFEHGAIFKKKFEEGPLWYVYNLL